MPFSAAESTAGGCCKPFVITAKVKVQQKSWKWLKLRLVAAKIQQLNPKSVDYLGNGDI
ncbi:hypothetical protein [Paenibacillus plantiphilus]|uniref:hypothetical protein n=1 Tax=Paenibacillus plantiphilus TaxID=2905650 RepID=UPI001F3582A0|nr:hypothetical protein [Paenibacillus plantiphilus]